MYAYIQIFDTREYTANQNFKNYRFKINGFSVLNVAQVFLC